MTLALLPLLFAAGASEPAAAPPSGVRAAVQVRAEIVVPVTNDLRGAASGPVRQVLQTRDGRWLIELQ